MAGRCLAFAPSFAVSWHMAMADDGGCAVGKVQWRRGEKPWDEKFTQDDAGGSAAIFRTVDGFAEANDRENEISQITAS